MKKMLGYLDRESIRRGEMKNCGRPAGPKNNTHILTPEKIFIFFTFLLFADIYTVKPPALALLKVYQTLYDSTQSTISFDITFTNNLSVNGFPFELFN